MKNILATADFDFNRLLEQIASVGAASVNILDEDFRHALWIEAETYDYRAAKEVVGSGDREVRQQLGTFESFPDDSHYLTLRLSFQEFLNDHFNALPEYPFEQRLNFNSAMLQRYQAGSLGITPHRDRSIYINLVCIFSIAGEGRFFVCADRSGRDAIEIDAAPGRVIFMKAPGFFGMQDRPFHYVKDIPGTRYTFGLRQQPRGTLDEVRD